MRLVAAWSIPFIPLERYVWEGMESSAQIAQRISAITQSASRLDAVPGERERDFSGTVSEEAFQLRPVLRYRNSFYPVISGRFQMVPQGTTRLTVYLRLAWPTVALLAFLFAILARFLWSIGEQASAGEVSPAKIVIPVAMLMFVIGITLGGFKQEARRVRTKLLETIGTDSPG